MDQRLFTGASLVKQGSIQPVSPGLQATPPDHRRPPWPFALQAVWTTSLQHFRLRCSQPKSELIIQSPSVSLLCKNFKWEMRCSLFPVSLSPLIFKQFGTSTLSDGCPSLTHGAMISDRTNSNRGAELTARSPLGVRSNQSRCNLLHPEVDAF